MTVAIKQGGQHGALKWAELKARYIELRVKGESITLAQFAAREGIPERTLKHHASREHWVEDAERLIKESDSRVVETLQSTRDALWTRLKTTEVEFRARLIESAQPLVLLARAATARLLARVQGYKDPVTGKDVPPEPQLLDTLDPADVARILSMAEEMQRKAASLGDKLTVEGDITLRPAGAEDYFQRRIRNREKVQALLSDFKNIIEGEVVERRERRIRRGASRKTGD